MARDVFISHSSKDFESANAVCAALEAQGIGCWIAPRDISPGSEWSEAIVQGIHECPVMVLIFSTNANQSPQVRREVQRAFEKGRSVVPLRIDEVTPDGAMEYYLGPVHWLNALTPPLQNHLNPLLEAVRRLLPAREQASPSGEDTGKSAPASASMPPLPAGNLPNPSTPFIGREAQLQEWQELLLRPTTRVLTLTGFGGLGKTRSALEIALRCSEDFPDGAWWVELEEARSGEEMLQRIANQLPLTLQPQPSAKEQLAAFLQNRNLLLALDNTEQIADAAVVVDALHKRAPNVKWLVTSRRALELAAEQVVEVPPLSQEDAQTLFIERAQARSPGFDRTDTNSADIAALCQRLEGMPLAIELAASRVVGMTPKEILDRLDEWFRLLQTRAPSLPPRQRALTGAIEWSHELLAEEDKALFAQLAVFAGGFSLNEAETICDAPDVFEGVHELRRHSFLRAETHATTQQMRFFMLELVRDFAQQKLSDEEIHQRHAEYFLRFASERAARMRTLQEEAALQELSADLDNIRAAFRWAQSGIQPELCARLALALYEPLYVQGSWTEAQQCLQAGYDAISQRTPSPADGREEGREKREEEDDPKSDSSFILHPSSFALRSDLALRLAGLALDRGDLTAARERAEECLQLSRERSDLEGTADAINLLGLIASDAGDRELAQQQFTQALQLRSEDDHYGRALSLHNLGRLAAQRGDLDEAQRLYAQSLIHRQAAGDRRGEAETLGNLGALAFRASRYDEARGRYLQSLALRSKLGERQGIALMLHNLGELAALEGDRERAILLYTHAERIFRDLNSAFAAASAQELQHLEQENAETFASIRAAVEKLSWQDVVKKVSI